MFNFIKNKLSTIYSHFSSKAHTLFSKSKIDESTLKELEMLLITADTGVKTTRIILHNLQQELKNGALNHGQDLKRILEEQLINLISKKNPIEQNPSVFLLVGINGSGKTTFAGKLAQLHRADQKKVLLVAGDTFRAGATDQLAQWAQKTQSTLFSGKEGQDPASVIFAACQAYKDNKYDILIIDTAGRLQTKTNLMRELEKIKRSITRQLPDASLCTLLTIDSMLGQNSFEQAKIFHESTSIDGLVLTKMDGTAKGGIVFAINQELEIPVAYISFGEQSEQIKPFHAQEYVQQLLTV
jgi:fused signal recognition particle receptor